MWRRPTTAVLPAWLLIVAAALVCVAPNAAADEPDDSFAEDGSEDEAPPSDHEEGDEVAEDAVELAGAMTAGDLPVFDLRPSDRASPRLAPLLADARAGRSRRVLERGREWLEEPDLHLRAAAIWLMTRAARRAGDRKALRQLWTVAASAGPLRDRAHLELATMARDSGDLDAALRHWAAVAADHPEAGDAALERAQILLDRGDVEAAGNALTPLRGAMLPLRLRPRLALLRGDVARRLGRRGEAVRAYLLAWRSDQAPADTVALERLVALGEPPGPLERVERLLGRRALRYRPRDAEGRARRRAALAELDAIAAASPGLGEYAHGAMLARRRDDRAEAVELLRQAVTATTDHEVAATAGLLLGDLLGKMGQDDEAVAILESALSRGQGRPIAQKIRWRLHRLYLYLGRGLDAERLLTELAAPDASSSYRLLALWSLAWRRFSLGDLGEAQRFLARLDATAGPALTGTRQPWRAKAGYWAGRIAAELGEKKAAARRWLEVARRWPQSYYGLLALDRLGEVEPALAARQQGSPPPEAGVATPPRIEEIRLARHPRLAEVALMVQLGELRVARGLLRDMLGRGLPPGAVQLLAALYAHDGHERAALAVLQRYVRRAGRPDSTTLGLWRAAFPTPFDAAIAKASQESGVSRSLIYAIARTESSFSPTARSGAGAYGLMQLLPKVAVKVAELWKIRPPSRRGLLRANANIACGSRYLAELARFFSGNTALVAVGYNAGPYAAQRWLQAGGVVPTDVYVESLPSGGARSYAMTIISVSATYAWLYPEWAELGLVRLGRAAMVPAQLGPFMTGPRSARVL